jgi:hypothetical protein
MNHEAEMKGYICKCGNITGAPKLHSVGETVKEEADDERLDPAVIFQDEDERSYTPSDTHSA